MPVAMPGSRHNETLTTAHAGDMTNTRKKLIEVALPLGAINVGLRRAPGLRHLGPGRDAYR